MVAYILTGSKPTGFAFQSEESLETVFFHTPLSFVVNALNNSASTEIQSFVQFAAFRDASPWQMLCEGFLLDVKPLLHSTSPT